MARVLALAMAYGWKPMGTAKNSEDWDGNYLHNAGQIVKDEDVLNLGEALSLALNSKNLDADLKKCLDRTLFKDSPEFVYEENGEIVMLSQCQFSFNDRRARRD